MTSSQLYVICIKNRGAAEDLEVRKVYQVLPDASAEKRKLVRVVDESGEDYLYPAAYFIPIALPKAATKVFSKRTA